MTKNPDPTPADFGEPLTGPVELTCLANGAMWPFGQGEEFPSRDLDDTSVLGGFAAEVDDTIAHGWWVRSWYRLVTRR